MINGLEGTDEKDEGKWFGGLEMLVSKGKDIDEAEWEGKPV